MTFERKSKKYLPHWKVPLLYIMSGGNSSKGYPAAHSPERGTAELELADC